MNRNHPSRCDCGIHYCTLVAMIEGSGEQNKGCFTLDLFENGIIHITGFRKAAMARTKKPPGGAVFPVARVRHV